MPADERFSRLDTAGAKLALAVVTAVGVGLLLPRSWSWMLRSLGGWCAGVSLFLGLAYRIMLTADE